MAEGEGNKFWTFIGTLLLIVVIAFIGFFIFNLVRSGQAEVYYKEAWTKVEPGAAQAEKGLFGWWEYYTNPEKIRNDFDSQVEENEDNVNLGIKIAEFDPLSPFFNEKKIVQTFARFEMASISNEEETVSLACSLEDYRGPVSVEPQSFDYTGNGNLEIRSAICKFPRGVRVDKKVESKIAQINATSDYYQMATYKAYFIRKDVDNRLRLTADNAFEYYGIVDPLLKKGKEMTSVVTEGPINIGIGTHTSQPFREGMEYIPLVITFNNRYLGNLVDIIDFKLVLPSQIELTTDPNACNFRFLRQDGEYNVYGLTPHAMEEKVNDFINYGSSTFHCNFRIIDFPLDSSDFIYTVFRLSTKYKYTIQKKTTVKIYNVDDQEDDDACLYVYDYSECLGIENCRPQMINETFTQCVACTYSNCEDEYSSNEGNCNLDPCNFDNCYFEDGRCRYENI